MKKNKLGFTLSEMLIALVLVGILGAVLSPVIRKMMPNQNKVMIKRTYYQVTNTVSKMLDDSNWYSPFGAVGGPNETTPIYVGFDNTNSVVLNGNTYSGQEKFLNIFNYIIGGKRIVDNSSISVSFSNTGLSLSYSGSYISLLTKDGVIWKFNSGSLSNSNIASIIIVDVNGAKAPNCFEGSNSCAGRTKDFDRYSLAVYNDGKIVVNKRDAWVRSVLDASSSVSAE